MKILYVLPTLVDGGGVEKILYDWISLFDKEKLTVDILAGHIISEKKALEFKKLGCSVYEFGNSMWNLWKRIPMFNKVLNNSYDIIHVHSSSPFDAWLLAIAQKRGIRTRIIHSHNAIHSRKLTTKIVFFFSKPMLRKYATHFWGCSEKAVFTLCGKQEKVVNNFRVIKNGIHINRYLYNKSIRQQIRKEYALENKFVIGNVGRLCSQKNQLFLLDVLVEVLKINPNTILILVGDGNQKNLLQKKAHKLGIAESIIFTGNVQNVSDFYQAMDVYVMTSLYEGLGIAGIEAQCAGLYCFFASSITPEVKITENAEFISLRKSPEYWAKKICSLKNTARNNMSEPIGKAGYDIESVSEDLQKLYQDINT